MKFEINIDTWVGVSACGVVIAWIVCKFLFSRKDASNGDARD